VIVGILYIILVSYITFLIVHHVIFLLVDGQVDLSLSIIFIRLHYMLCGHSTTGSTILVCD
jgi:hypothetical protein